MKKTKRIISLLSMALAIVLAFCSCGGSDDAGNVKLNDGSAGEYAITTEPTELTLFMVRNDDKVVEELPVWQEIAKLTNISLKTANSTSISDVNQALTTMLASGQLPDIVVSTNIKNFAEEYGMQGAFVKLNEMVNAEDTPNLKAQLDRLEVKNTITASDGNVYYIPDISPDDVPANGWFIRKDWLDKLGLGIPTNIDEYYNALKAFREQDPNGNGQKDEVPYLYRFKSPDALLEMQNVPTRWGVDENGKVYYSPITNEFKDGMKLMAKWYAEGLIDKEIYTRGSKSREKLFGDNLGGSTHDYFGTTAQFNDLLAETIPGFKLVAIAPPGGKEYSARAAATSGGASIAASSAKKEVAVRFLDFLYSEVGSRFQNFGIEGVHYDMKDGKPYFRDFVIHGEDTAINVLSKSGAAADLPYVQDFWYEEQWLTEEALKGFELYMNNDLTEKPFPTLSYTKEEKDRFTVLNSAIDTYTQENLQKWVFGAADVDSTFDSYVEQIKSMGIDELVSIVQSAYDRYISAE